MRISVRLWQTALFVTVILVAMLILGTTLFGALERVLEEGSVGDLDRQTAELSRLLQDGFSTGEADRQAVAREVGAFVDIFGGDVWVLDLKGGMLYGVFETFDPRAPDLARARDAALNDDVPYAVADIEQETRLVAGRGIFLSGRRVGGVVIARSGERPLAILNAARDQMRTAFWIALAVSGLLGFAFSEVIARQVRRMSEAALAIAGGDFDQKVPRTRLPDEIGTLAESFNLMTEHLGKAFAAIQGHEREIAAVVESMVEGVVAVDGARVVRHANPAAARLLGIDPARIVDHHVEEVVRGDEMLGLVDEALEGRQAVETVDHANRVLMLHATPIAAAEDQGGGAVLLIRDVTEQKRWEQAQQEFIANASHEMRTPIAALRGFMELLEGGAKEKAGVRDEFLRTMQAEIDRLQRLVGDLFTLAQLDSGRVRLEVMAHRVEELIGDVVAVMGPLADDAGVTLATDVQAPTAEVLCDRDRTVQVLLGFVDNALKHIERGDTVTVWARPEGPRFALGVSDTGPGIPPTKQERIFERFYRASDDPEMRRRGTGLGLAIAKEIVEAHASEIRVRSQTGRGAEFSFTLERAA